MSEYELDGNKEVQRISGQSTVLLIHGLASSRLDWENLIPILDAAGYPSFALDLLGHGDGLKPTSAEDYGYENFVNHFETWIEQEGFSSPLVLIGHSLGGYLSLAYTLRHPENVKALVLISPLYTAQQLSPWVRYIRMRPHWGVRALQHVPRWIVRAGYRLQSPGSLPLPEDVRRQMGIDTLRASPNIFHIISSLPDLEPQLADVRVPSLVLWGTKDMILNPRLFPALVDSLNQASAYVVPSAGHELHRACPELVSSQILQFLSSISLLTPDNRHGRMDCPTEEL